MQATWNEVMRGSQIPLVFKLTDIRVRGLRRIGSTVCREGIGLWRTVCEMVLDDPWCRGERHGRGHDNWTASLDWVIRGDNALRYLERAASQQQQAEPAPAAIAADIVEMDPLNTGNPAADAANRERIAAIQRVLG